MDKEVVMQKKFMEMLLDEYMEAQGYKDSAEIQEAEAKIKTRLKAIDPHGVGVHSVWDDCMMDYFNAIMDQGFSWGFKCAMALLGAA